VVRSQSKISPPRGLPVVGAGVYRLDLNVDVVVSTFRQKVDAPPIWQKVRLIGNRPQKVGVVRELSGDRHLVHALCQASLVRTRVGKTHPQRGLELLHEVAAAKDAAIRAYQAPVVKSPDLFRKLPQLVFRHDFYTD